MAVQAISKEQMMQLLNEWYQEIRSQNLIKSRQLKNQIEQKLQSMEHDPTQTLFVYYSLLDSRYLMLINDLTSAEKTLQNIDLPLAQTDDFITYYYYFFKAILTTKTGNYSDARQYYIKAENYLKYVDDEIENAEFNYKVAIFYYHIEQPLLATHYASKAKSLFEEKPGYEISAADCENILGLACISLKQFEEAEEHFIAALSIAEEKKHEKLSLTVRYNLGLLYADQNLSAAAINRLKFVYEKGVKLDKTTFLLAREYYKIGEPETAVAFVEEGLKHCEEANNEEYRIHLNILHKMNHSVEDTELESAVKEGIDYFNKEELWIYVQDYAEKLAVRFYNKNKAEKSNYYFYIAYEAKQKLLERGALK
ncbi:tetratricopeptide repeat protein [Fictibacillus gelatini]|uniref:response regulator aspartate phosphatase n=1 Tax=Fictibacillus gelatini TaxID=225985 RepID=UPI000407711A|nr:tetratricopeptide repeat protein [Fictibacillus gelatini]